MGGLGLVGGGPAKGPCHDPGDGQDNYPDTAAGALTAIITGSLAGKPVHHSGVGNRPAAWIVTNCLSATAARAC